MLPMPSSAHEAPKDSLVRALQVTRGHLSWILGQPTFTPAPASLRLSVRTLGEMLESFGGELTSCLPRTKGVLWKKRAVYFPGKNPTFTAFERLLER